MSWVTRGRSIFAVRNYGGRLPNFTAFVSLFRGLKLNPAKGEGIFCGV